MFLRARNARTWLSLKEEKKMKLKKIGLAKARPLDFWRVRNAET